MTPILELRGVRKQFGSGTVAVDGITLSISGDQPLMTAIAGESGSGKTTLARLMLGIIHPTEGQVLYQGRDIAAMSKTERRELRRNVQPIFQDPFEVFNPFYRVDHVLASPIRHFKLATSKREARRLMEEAIELVGLRPAETLGRFPHELSGGQRQRLMIARVLLPRPQVILADEPVSMLDASLRATILDTLVTLNRELDISVVYITHDLTTAYQICENIIVLYGGSIAEAGAVEQVIRSPKHPYTQLLVSSIPLPDPRHRWAEELVPEDSLDRRTSGCKFAPRCPARMDECFKTIPALYLPDPHRVTACFLHRESAVLESTDIAEVYEPRGDALVGVTP